MPSQVTNTVHDCNGEDAKSVCVSHAFRTFETYKAQNLHEAKVTLQHWFLSQSDKIPFISSVTIMVTVLDGRSDCFGLCSIAKFHGLW